MLPAICLLEQAEEQERALDAAQLRLEAALEGRAAGQGDATGEAHAAAAALEAAEETLDATVEEMCQVEVRRGGLPPPPSPLVLSTPLVVLRRRCPGLFLLALMPSLHCTAAAAVTTPSAGSGSRACVEPGDTQA